MPMEEQASVLLRYLLQPKKGFDNRFAMEAFVLSAYPIGKHHVEVVHYFYKFSFTEFVVTSKECAINSLVYDIHPQRLRWRYWHYLTS